MHAQHEHFHAPELLAQLVNGFDEGRSRHARVKENHVYGRTSDQAKELCRRRALSHAGETQRRGPVEGDDPIPMPSSVISSVRTC
jgi:hypothetical protein